jgi:uncharacterized protein (TIGR02001 family)
LLLGAALTFAAADALAQVSGSVSVLSDYRYRGISLTRSDPALQASLAYDDPSGIYAGLFASNVEFAISPHRELQGVPYIGYARRLSSGLSAEIGASYSAFSGPGGYDYAEIYAGVSGDQASGRVYYAPRYFGRGASAYAEVNGAQPLAERVRLLAHVGVLFNLGHYFPYGPADRQIVDGRLGLAIDFDAFSLQASWVGVGSSNTGYPISPGERRNTVVVTLSRSF